MNSDSLIIKLNKLETWLESTTGQFRLFPLRMLGYLALISAIIVSNFVAVLRWPLVSLSRIFKSGNANSPGEVLDTGIPIEVDREALQRAINNHPLVLVDFWAEWCGPCIMMNEPLKKLAASNNDQCIVVKINTVKHPEVAEEFDVKGLPTLVVFREGKEVKRYAGALSYSELKEFIPG